MGGIKKRFPATLYSKELTFLTDKKIDGELYGYLQAQSYARELGENSYETYIKKDKLPKQVKICELLGIKSTKTLRAHLDYLVMKQYVLDNGDEYILPEKEEYFFPIPLDTLNYLNDNCREHVIKIYIYLGQNYNRCLKKDIQFEFTLESIGAYLGINIKNSSRGYEIINNALDLLQNSGLIKYVSYFNGTSQIKKLISVDTAVLRS